MWSEASSAGIIGSVGAIAEKVQNVREVRGLRNGSRRGVPLTMERGVVEIKCDQECGFVIERWECAREACAVSCISSAACCSVIFQRVSRPRWAGLCEVSRVEEACPDDLFNSPMRFNTLLILQL